MEERLESKGASTLLIPNRPEGPYQETLLSGRAHVFREDHRVGAHPHEALQGRTVYRRYRGGAHALHHPVLRAGHCHLADRAVPLQGRSPVAFGMFLRLPPM